MTKAFEIFAHWKNCKSQSPAGAEFVPPQDIRLVDREAGDGEPAHGGVGVDVSGMGHQPQPPFHRQCLAGLFSPFAQRQLESTGKIKNKK